MGCSISAWPGLAGEGRKRILDLGCGTGMLCTAFAARGHEVTGVDPAATMLAVARSRPHGVMVEWVEARAQEFRDAGRYDLVVMTGHAFQVLLDDADVAAVMRTMREQLAVGGLVAFETRNPAVDLAARWDGEAVLSFAAGSVRRRRVVERPVVGDRIAFETEWRFADRVLSSRSEKRFLDRHGVEERLRRCGLRVRTVYGDWDGRGFDPRCSDKMIFLVGTVE